MPIILFINLKGGVAKTTDAVATAEALASGGHRTLLIDADHQCMASELTLGEDRFLRCENRRATLHDLLAAMLDDEFSPDQFPHFITPKASDIGGGLELLDVLPSSIRIDDFSTNMAKARRGHHSNNEFLQMLRNRRAQLATWLNQNYAFTIIDCPPSIAVQVRFLLGVGDYFIVPSIPDRLSVRGSVYLMERLKSAGFKIRGLGTLWSLHREQNSMHRKIVEMGTGRIKPLQLLPRPFTTIIPNAAQISDATVAGRVPINLRAKYGPRFAALFEALCFEIRSRCGVHEKEVGRAKAA